MRGACLLLALIPACGKRPPTGFPQLRSFTVAGKVEKIEPVEGRILDGTYALVSATVRVSRVEGNEGGEPVRPGDAIRVQWMRFVKKPTKPTPGFDPIDHDIKVGDEGTFRVEGYGRPYGLVRRKDAFERSR